MVRIEGLFQFLENVIGGTIFFFYPLSSVFSDPVVVAHGASRFDCLFDDDLFDGEMILRKLFLRFAIYHIIEIDKVEIGTVEIAVR
jgi:hypothetical protein